MKLSVNKIEVASIDLSEISGNEYIEDVEVLEQGTKKGHLHLIFRYSYQSNPGSYGRGSCGAGIEEFVGYIRVDGNFEVDTFDKLQTQSCIDSNAVVEVEYDKGHPEFGIWER